jgi:excisionase family DNA binding protein
MARKIAAVVAPAPPSFFSRHALRVPQAAEYVGGTNWFVEELIRNGEIEFREYGKYRTLDADDLDEWIKKQQKKRIVQNKTVAA